MTIHASDGSSASGGIDVEAGGSLTMRYAVQIGGDIAIRSGGKATIEDTMLSTENGSRDLLVVGGGTLKMQYTEIGGADKGGAHTNLMVQGVGNTVNVTYCTIRGASYGLMLYGGANAIFRYNNWENAIDVDTVPGVSGDFSGSYFRQGVPTNAAQAQLVLNNLSNAPLVNAQPRR